MDSNINLALAIAGVFQSVLLGYLVISRSKALPATKLFFLAYILVLTLQILLKGLSKIWVTSNFSFLSILAYELPLLYGPLAYLYIKDAAVVERRSATWKHFLPFAAAFLLLLLFRLFPDNETILALLPNTTGKRIFHALLLLASLSIYFLYARKHLLSYQQLAVQNLSDYEKVKLPWLRSFNLANFICGSVIIVALELMYQYYPHLMEIRYLFLALTLLVYWISYQMISTPYLLDLRRQSIAAANTNPIVREPETLHSKETDTVSNSQEGPDLKSKYSKSSLSGEGALLIHQKLKSYMEESRAYLDRDLTLDKIAEQTQISKHNISQALNERLNTSYFDFVNQYRMEHAKNMLMDPAFDYLTIAAIAKECGFHSASGFNNVFKKMVGSTPSQFKKKRTLPGDRSHPTAKTALAS